MNYVVKVGEWYVKGVWMPLTEIKLSKEIMRSFTKENAEALAKQLNGEVVEIIGEVTNE